MKRKVDQCTGLLRRVRPFITKDLTLHLYKSLIAPHFPYCKYIYDDCSLTSKRILQVRQNNALRAVLEVAQRFPTDRLHGSLNIDWLDINRQKSTCIEVHKNIHGHETSNLEGIIKQYQPVLVC